MLVKSMRVSDKSNGKFRKSIVTKVVRMWNSLTQSKRCWTAETHLMGSCENRGISRIHRLWQKRWFLWSIKYIMDSLGQVLSQCCKFNVISYKWIFPQVCILNPSDFTVCLYHLPIQLHTLNQNVNFYSLSISQLNFKPLLSNDLINPFNGNVPLSHPHTRPELSCYTINNLYIVEFNIEYIQWWL